MDYIYVTKLLRTWNPNKIINYNVDSQILSLSVMLYMMYLNISELCSCSNSAYFRAETFKRSQTVFEFLMLSTYKCNYFPVIFMNEEVTSRKRRPAENNLYFWTLISDIYLFEIQMVISFTKVDTNWIKLFYNDKW